MDFNLYQNLLLNSDKKISKRKKITKRMKTLTNEKIFKIIDEITDICNNQCYVKSENEKVPGQQLVVSSDQPKNPEVVTKQKIDLIYNLTLSLLIKIYGSNNEFFSNFQSQLTDCNYNEKSIRFSDIIAICLAKLEFVKKEIELGLLNTLENQISGEIVTDFLLLARKSLDEDNKAVSAVLSCASLEDALKRFAKSNEINIEDKSMAEVVNSLKSKGLISSTQGNILKSYTQIRNKAFHAEWDKIDKSDVSSIIGFTEQFIIENFE